MSEINIITVPVVHFPKYQFSKYFTPHVKDVMENAYGNLLDKKTAAPAWLQECKSTAGKDLQEFIKLEKPGEKAEEWTRWHCST